MEIGRKWKRAEDQLCDIPSFKSEAERTETQQPGVRRKTRRVGSVEGGELLSSGVSTGRRHRGLFRRPLEAWPRKISVE